MPAQTVIFPVNLTSLELLPTYTLNSPLGTTHFAPSQTLRSLLLNLNVAVELAPTARLILLNPRSCFGGALALAGYPMYSCGTSAPATPPELVIFAVMVETVSKRSTGPPGPLVPVAGPAVGAPVTVRASYVKFV